MIGEVAVAAKEAAVEVGKKAAEIASETAKETVKGIGKEKSVDITKRIDITNINAGTSRNKVDITKRIVPETVKEITGTDVGIASKEYVKDLKDKSICPETLSIVKIDASKLEVQDPTKVAEMREAFDENKTKIRREWEKVNNREWPKYKEDVYNENGVRIRKAGDNYDAHHIVPLQLGGTNEASNITPLDITKHREVHLPSGSCNKLVEAVKGVEKL